MTAIKQYDEHIAMHKYIPDDSVGAAADGHDRRAILAGDLKEVPKYVVLYVAAAVGGHCRELREVPAGRHVDISHLICYLLN